MDPILELTSKEIIELRIKCLEPYVAIGSKANIEQDTVIKKAEVAWKFAIKPLLEKGDAKSPGESQPSSPESKS